VTDEGSRAASRRTVREYLAAAYLVEDEVLDHVMGSPQAKDAIADAERSGSHAFWPGDKLAVTFLLEANPAYDPDAEEDEE